MKLINLNFKFNDNLTSILLIYLDTVALFQLIRLKAVGASPFSETPTW